MKNSSLALAAVFAMFGLGAADPAHVAAVAPPGETATAKKPANPCQLVRCASGTTCVNVGGSAHCVAPNACKTTKCEKGQHCQLEKVTCVTSPCNPVAKCVDNKKTNPCDAVRCASGTHCVPFDGRAHCVSTGEKCGTTVCKPGQVCESVVCIKAPCYPVCSDPATK